MLPQQSPFIHPTLFLDLLRLHSSTPRGLLGQIVLPVRRSRVFRRRCFDDPFDTAIAEHYNVDAKAALENIVYARAHNSEHREWIIPRRP